MVDRTKCGEFHSEYPRRSFLAVGTGVTTGLVGCLGDSRTDSTPASTGDGTSQTTARLVHTTTFNPEQFNAAGWQAQSGYGTGFYIHWKPLLWASGFWSNYSERPFYLAIEDIQNMHAGCTQEIRLVDGLEWWDGTPVTPETTIMQDRMLRYQTYGPDIEGKGDKEYEQIDERTYQISYERPQNLYNLKYPPGGTFWLKPSVYGEFLERYEDATTQEAVDDVTRDLTQDFSISMEKFVEDGIGSGPWRPSDWTQTSMTLEKVNDHPIAPGTLDTLKIDMVGDRTKRLERYRQGDFDAVHFNDAGNVDFEKLEEMSVTNEFSFNATINIHFKFHNKHLRRPGVRRAIAYVLDLGKAETLLETNGIPATPVEDQVDLPINTKDTYLSDGFRSKLIKYGVGSKAQQARQAMQSAGYSKQGGRWVGPDGDAIGPLQFLNPTGIKKLEIVAQYVSSALQEFGIPNELRFESFNTWTEEFRESGEGPDMSTHWGGSGSGPGYPFDQWVQGDPSTPPPITGPAHFMRAVPEDYEVPTGDTCEPVDIEAPPLDRKTDPIFHHPIRPTYPSEIGALDVSGDGQTLYPIKWKWEADQAADQELINERSERFAWYNNWAVPRVTVYSETIQIGGNTRDFTWESDTPLSFSQRSTVQMAFGAATPK
jgi:hypothetical protein